MGTRTDKVIAKPSEGVHGGKTMLAPHPSGPMRCLVCAHPFEKGQVWRLCRSSKDPDSGSYAVGIHEECARG